MAIFVGIILFAFLIITYCRHTRPKPNLLLITLDTTRADRLGCYGYAKAITPALDSLAQNGSLFKYVYAPAPITLPSHATMLTGLYPPEHGLRNNGKNSLNAQVPLLPEILSKHGYQTGAFIASTILNAKFGLNRGFQFYDDKSKETADNNSIDLMADDDNMIQDYRPANEITDAAIKWFSGIQQDHPFFCWVHYYDPHNPRYDHRETFPAHQFDSKYDAEIAFMDLHISRLLSFLHDRDLLENTVIVAVGDHGESLGEHGENTHGLTVYNAVMRVPLLISFPNRIKPGLRISTPVSLVDLFPTILSMLSVNTESQGQALKDIMTRSAAPALAGKETEARAWYGETYATWENFKWAPLKSYADKEWKYIHTAKPELYNTVSDPNELTNIIGEHSDIAANMREKLLAECNNMMITEPGTVKLDPDEIKALQSLGYMAGGKSTQPLDQEITNLPDIKDMIPLASLYWHVCSRITRRDFSQETQDLCNILVTNSPGSPRFHACMGNIQMARGMKQEAEAGFNEALRLDPDAINARNNLALLLIERGEIELAIEHLTTVITLDPDRQAAKQNLFAAHNQIGLMLGERGKFEQAEEHFRSSIAIDPASAPSHLNLGVALLSQNRIEQAIAEFEEALRIDPDYQQAKRNLRIARQAKKKLGQD